MDNSAASVSWKKNRKATGLELLMNESSIFAGKEKLKSKVESSIITFFCTDGISSMEMDISKLIKTEGYN